MLLELCSIDSEEQFKRYSISQYDALMLAIKYEQELFFEQLIKNTNINPAINKLKNE